VGLLSKIIGTISNSFTIGDGTTADKYLYADNGGANLPGFRRLNSSGVWEYSNDGTNWLSLAATAPLFGQNYQYAADETTTTTTSSTFQDKVTLTTEALTGTYRVAFNAEATIASSNKDLQVRLYNSTNAVEMCFEERLVGVSGNWCQYSGFMHVTFTGALKAFKIQFASQNNVAQVSCRRARIEFWRVS